MRAIPQAAIDLVRDQEETHLFVYDDAFYPPHECVPGQAITGTLTAGTGHTGTDVVIGMIVTAEMDAKWLEADLLTASGRLFQRIDGVIDDLTDNQYAALLDFVFNLGANPAWTIWKRLRAKQFDQVPLEMQKFVNSGGKKLNGLVARRNAEVALWSKDEPGTIDIKVPSSVTRATITPPTPADPIPASKSKGLILGGAGALAGLGPICDQISHAISPYAPHSDYVAKMLGILATISAGCAAAGIFYFWLQKRNARN